ncbi:hypothetical protein [Limimaricola cinnabarinus]|uniref:hypothetical protein n=1 Tax=Limimaricola cinnabarinus TaxID=1125964 RepID=UPI0024936337|nr:hypothetical protein [Limimaricola cinnabarinus]
MTGLRFLSYLFIAAGVVAVVLVGLNAFGLNVPWGERPSGYVEPGMTPLSGQP